MGRYRFCIMACRYAAEESDRLTEPAFFYFLF
jgi:hypothetical protein